MAEHAYWLSFLGALLSFSLLIALFAVALGY